jgi:hypothetical protein
MWRSLLIILLKVLMVKEPWYVRKLVQYFCTSKKPLRQSFISQKIGLFFFFPLSRTNLSSRIDLKLQAPAAWFAASPITAAPCWSMQTSNGWLGHGHADGAAVRATRSLIGLRSGFRDGRTRPKSKAMAGHTSGMVWETASSNQS